ncbi:MAG TPA: hypothetical protein DCY13_12695, partial [Verrucomicrobiales bacterium]|nr:hypothetical protein [Verrucomicrobiales bacterium]
MTNVMNRGSRWAALALATLTAGHATAGTIEQFFYAEIAGSTVRDLTNSALFPTSPIIATPLHWQGTTLEGITNASVNYGSWLRGYLEPPMSGGYRFYVAAADSAELHLSTDHQPGNRRLIAGTTAPTERDSWTRFPSQTSPLIELEAGRQYYFEVRHKFGQAGQDYVRVGWQLPDGSAELPIPLARVQNFLSETSSGPGITNVAQLAPVIREPDLSRLRENRPVTITPEVDYAPPAIFQWFENGVPIPEANTSSLALGNLTTNDTGRTFTLVVDTATGSAMSADMVLQVLDDLVPPTLLAARTDGNSAGFNLYFSEPVDPATATDVANYTLSAGTIDRIEPRYGVEDSVYVVHMTLPGGVFTVTVNNVTDRSAAANVIAPGTTATVNLAAGFITAHYFGAINGGSPIVATTIENLILVTNRFPNHPDLIEELPEFGIPHNRADNYGVRVFGYLVPPVTGDYSFAIASDGQGLLYLSTDDSPANKRAIAVEPEWNGRRNYATPDRRSINRANSNGDLLIQTHFPGIGNDVQVNDSLNTVGAIPMVAGHRYYVEAIAAEAGGGDNLDVAWRLPGQTSIPFQGVIPGTHLSPIETGPDQAVEIVQQPADRSVPENRSIVFSVTHNGLAPFEYAWFRNGMPVVGANQRELTVFPTLADDQAVFTLRVRNRFSQDVTAPIKLTVIPDNTPPQILRAAADRHFDRVHLMFDERIRMDSASSPDQYHVTTEDGQTRLPVLGISFGPAEQGGVANVSLHTTGIQSGVRYRVATEGIRDTSAAGNATAIQQTVSFTGWVLTRGYVNYERFQDLPGDTIPDLTNAAKYPRNPDTAGYLTSWETPESVSDNFGSVISGMIIPPTSGFYQFYTASDRSSELWISTDASPANLMSVAADPMWASRREWTGNAGGRRQNNENVSQALQLVAGSFYRAELLHKASTGFDHAGATWRTPGGTAPINGSPSTLVGRSIAAWGNPDATTITITTQPADKVLPEGTSAQFTAAAGLETHFGPLFPTMNFQWYTNNVPVVGATQATYTTPNLGCLDDQMRVHCEIFVPGNTVATRQALITVIYGEPPQLVLVTGSDTLDRIVLQFDEPVAADTVNQLANYQISGLTITGAAHDPADPRRIILNTSAQTPGTRHSYDISGIADQSACRNLMARTTGEFTAWQLAGGWVKHELYRISSGGELSLLTSHPKFPSAPDAVSYVE